jgi:hypothetical protein
MYGALEEERGLARHAMRIYERATRAVSDEDRFALFNFYITKSASNFGLTSTRPIYERAIAALPDNEAGTCVSNLQRWSDGWARLTVPAPFTVMRHSSVIRALRRDFGRNGRPSKFNTETKIRLRRCFESREVYGRSTSKFYRLSRSLLGEADILPVRMSISSRHKPWQEASRDQKKKQMMVQLLSLTNVLTQWLN